MRAHRERPAWDSVYAWKEAMKDIFARCFKKTAVQVCTVIYALCLVILCAYVSCSNSASRESDS